MTYPPLSQARDTLNVQWYRSPMPPEVFRACDKGGYVMSRRRLLGNDTHLPNIHQRMPSESNAMRAALSSNDTWRQNDGYERSREGHSSH